MTHGESFMVESEQLQKSGADSQTGPALCELCVSAFVHFVCAMGAYPIVFFCAAQKA
jgi:hypothetical protein